MSVASRFLVSAAEVVDSSIFVTDPLLLERRRYLGVEGVGRGEEGGEGFSLMHNFLSQPGGDAKAFPDGARHRLDGAYGVTGKVQIGELLQVG